MQSRQSSSADCVQPVLGIVEERPHRFRFGFLVPAALVFLLGTAVTAAAMLAASRSEQLEILAEFQLDAEERFSAYEHEVNEVLGFLRCLGGLYSASQNVEQQEFENFIERSLPNDRAIGAVFWAPRVQENEREAFERQMQAAGYRDFRIIDRDDQGQNTAPESRAEYFPILHAHSNNILGPLAGFDIGSEATAGATIRAARYYGTERGTGSVSWYSAASDHAGDDYVLFMPVYRAGISLDTIESRNKGMIGTVGGVFRVGAMLEASLSRVREDRGIDMYVFDRAVDVDLAGSAYLGGTDQLLTDVPPEKAPELDRSLHAERIVDLGGRERKIVCVPTPAYFAKRSTPFPYVLGGFGFVCSSLAALLIWALMARGRQIEEIVRRRTYELVQAQAQIRQDAHELAVKNAALEKLAMKAEADASGRTLTCKQ